ncbi:DUF6884 domain-containing protein [Blastococcus sp. URHD0036]|uniref:DUF6884 domain-containing protein n=1 Tax=Blastococcus sp. URHD0036 TaxID=1380356 RepID=UPI00068FF1F7|nr:DUF6884 domain-containing protein [Blastococcus sp. URHD0036]
MSNDSIWDLVRQASESLPEPFSRSALLARVRQLRPDVEESSIGTHIQYATANATNASNPFRGRTPLLERVGRGEYRRYRGSAPTVTLARPASAKPSTPARSSAANVVLIGCSSSKAPSARQAAELFTGAAFTKASELARRGSAPWYVLSAKFGLLDPTEVVAPYDVYLADQPRTYRTAWGAWVVAQLATRHDLARAVVEVHAGRAYCEPLAAPLAAAGATLTEPLAGLGLGKRLAWYGSDRTPERPEQPEHADLSSLLDGQNAIAPAAFLAGGRATYGEPGLYSWWVDDPGATGLSAGLGHLVQPGLAYAGRAGGQRPNGKVSSNTLWGRVGGMHLQGNRDFSTFRLTLTAALRHSGTPVADEAELSRWMHAHLRVAVLPLPADGVFAAEEKLLELTDPPLNLSGMPATPLRRTLSRLRSELAASS